MTIAQICRDETLYGHALTSLPRWLLDFSWDEFNFYDRPDTGTLVVDKDYILARAIHYQTGRTYTYQTETILDNLLGKPFMDLIEFVVRRVLALLAAAVSSVTVLPIGMSVKVLHLALRQMPPMSIFS